jgi:hypothetical protein
MKNISFENNSMGKFFLWKRSLETRNPWKRCLEKVHFYTFTLFPANFFQRTFSRGTYNS